MDVPAPFLGLLLRSALLGALLAPCLAGAAVSERLAVIRAPSPFPREVERAFAGALAEVATEVPADDACRSDDAPCLAALARAAGAPAALHASLRTLGGTPTLSLALVPADPGRPPARRVEALRPGVPVEPAIREGVLRLLAPERVVGSLEVAAAPGSEIWIDGERRGVAPLPAFEGLSPGQHLLRVVRPGAGEARGTVEVRFEALARVRVEPRSDELQLLPHRAVRRGGPDPGPGEGGLPASPAPPREPAAAAFRPEGRPAPGETAPVPVPTAALPAPEGEPPASPWTVVGWSALGAGGALALGAVLPALAAVSSREEARALRDAEGRLPPPHAARDRRLAADAAAHDRTAGALLAVGASLLVGGATVLLLDLDGEGS